MQRDVQDHELLTMHMAMFYTAVWPIFLVLIQGNENGQSEITDFSAIFDRIEFAQMVIQF